MPHAPHTPLPLRELLLRSDFGRLNPRRVSELLDRTADPLTECRNAPRQQEPCDAT